MYRYDEFDAAFVRQRVAQFRDQVARRLNGELTEDEFKPLRLKNGVYLQLHAYMLRIAVPYGTLSARQLRKLAHIARTYDRGFGHFTTRQNLQFNWPKLSDIPDILAELAEVEMHAIQTITSPAPPPKKLPIRAPMRKSSANGHPCTPSSAFCRANSRSALPPPSTTAAPSKLMTSACS
jgi:hypothetical protein